MQTVIPVIYDEHGNRALLGAKVGNYWPELYGQPGKITTLEIAHYGSDFIEMGTPMRDRVDLSDYKNLPEDAKYKKNEDIDDNIELLIKDGQIKNINKSTKGSPNAKVTYNFEIIEGDYSKWR